MWIDPDGNEPALAIVQETTKQVITNVAPKMTTVTAGAAANSAAATFGGSATRFIPGVGWVVTGVTIGYQYKQLDEELKARVNADTKGWEQLTDFETPLERATKQKFAKQLEEQRERADFLRDNPGVVDGRGGSSGHATITVESLDGISSDEAPINNPTVKLKKVGDNKYYVDSQGRTVKAVGVNNGSHRGRKKKKAPTPLNGLRSGDHRGHLISEGGTDDVSTVNIPENVVSEHPKSNLGLKKSFDLKASKLKDANPNSDIITEHEPYYRGEDTRPRAVTHTLYKDGDIEESLSVLNPD